MKVAFEYEYDIILANTAPTELSLHLITSDFFRYMFTNTEVLKESYSELIQAIELLVSKLQNNERLDDKIYIKN